MLKVKIFIKILIYMIEKHNYIDDNDYNNQDYYNDYNK